ncbi:MAG: hypothetical protein Q9M35_07160 [Rhodothermus sp.]|nr:hypothetical protein [Rhodothermus sp.]
MSDYALSDAALPAGDANPILSKQELGRLVEEAVRRAVTLRESWRDQRKCRLLPPSVLQTSRWEAE